MFLLEPTAFIEPVESRVSVTPSVSIAAPSVMSLLVPPKVFIVMMSVSTPVTVPSIRLADEAVISTAPSPASASTTNLFPELTATLMSPLVLSLTDKAWRIKLPPVVVKVLLLATTRAMSPSVVPTLLPELNVNALAVTS